MVRSLPDVPGDHDSRHDRHDGRHHDWHDGRHVEAPTEEWVFAAWTPDGRLGLISGHRIVGRTAWYWAALAREGRPLLHITDFDVPIRADPFVVKGEALWAEHHCDAEMEQWSIGNETYASAIEDADEALGRAYGDPTPIAFDLEWYATAPATPLEPAGDRAGIDRAGVDRAGVDRAGVDRAGVDRAGVDSGYEQLGVVHGAVDVLGEPRLEFTEIPAHRWHRWTTHTTAFGPLALPEVRAHVGVRAPFAFPDGSVSDLVLTPAGWARRAARPA